MKQQKQQFPGFPKEPTTNYWQYPRICNGWWHLLTGSEQKVLDYILRHTWGYNKTSDRISISQFRDGIINKKTGKIVDKGTGIKKRNVILKAIKRLEKLGFIRTIQKPGKIKEFKLVTNGYTTSNQRLPVASNQRLHTITDVTIKDIQEGKSSVSLRSTDSPSSSKAQPPSEASPILKAKDPKVQEVIQFFYDACEKIRSFKPRISPHVEVKMIKSYLKDFTVDQLTDELDWFLKSEECEKLGCTIKVALSAYVFNKWLDQRETY